MSRGISAKDVLNLYLFIDWLIALPEDLEVLFIQDLEQYEREKQMPYVTTIERRAKQQGLIEGALDAIEFGLELKFGQAGLQLMSEISQISDLAILKSIQAGLRQGKNLDELRTLYQNKNE